MKVTMQSKKTKVGIDELRDEKEKEWSRKNDLFPVCFSAPRLRRLIAHTYKNKLHPKRNKKSGRRQIIFLQ